MAADTRANNKTNFATGQTVTQAKMETLVDTIFDTDRGGVQFTAPPAAANWTWLNQGDATLTDGTNKLTVKDEAGSNTNPQAILRSVTAPYTVTMAFQLTFTPSTDVSKEWTAGPCFSNGTGLIVLDMGTGNSNAVYRLRKWTNVTTFSADYFSRTISTFPAPQLIFGGLHWIRLKDDSTNRIIQWSGDGENWATIHSIGRTDFITANQVGLELRCFSGGMAAVTLLSWVEA